jgi:spore coat polysaccharide biosynthesis predicted glycosyltransferase SpsG
LHIDSREVAGLMSGADIAIGGAGTGSWERCCVGLPSLVIVTDDNQKAVAAELTRSGAAVNLGEWPSVTSAEIAQALRLLADDPERRNAMAEAAASLCDGLGADRLAGELVRDLADGSRDMRI